MDIAISVFVVSILTASLVASTCVCVRACECVCVCVHFAMLGLFEVIVNKVTECYLCLQFLSIEVFVSALRVFKRMLITDNELV